LEALLTDPEVTDVLVNGPGEVWVDRGRGLERAGVEQLDDLSLRRLAQRLASACGRRLDDSQPWVDARLPDGTRFHAVLPPVAGRGVCLSLRTFRPVAFSLAELVTAGTVEPVAAELLVAMMAARLAFLVTGGTGSGKTTLLGTLLSLADPGDRIVLIEDAAELRPIHPHVVSLEARPSNAEGAGAVTLRDLIRQALRMRPDRIVVGECRGAEVAELLSALNTGHLGGAGTLHANSPGDVPARMAALGASGGLTPEAMRVQLAAAIQCVVHVVRSPGGRILQELCHLRARSGAILPVTVWHRRTGWGPGAEEFHRLLAERGTVSGDLP
jgi:pilus assembly protein CpaF